MKPSEARERKSLLSSREDNVVKSGAEAIMHYFFAVAVGYVALWIYSMLDSVGRYMRFRGLKQPTSSSRVKKKEQKNSPAEPVVHGDSFITARLVHNCGITETCSLLPSV